MTTLDLTPVAGGPLAAARRDAWVICLRNLRMTARSPELLVFSTIQPVMFVLLFRYVFGGAIGVPDGIGYASFLMPGIFVQTSVFTAMLTGMGLAQDLEKGLVDRFRSLPMARSAVLTGRTLADVVRNVVIVVVMLAVGLAVGFRFGNGVLPTLGAFGLLLVFAYTFSWISAWIGLTLRNVEAVQSGGFIWLFPLTFASTAFVPLRSMPGWLQAFAGHQPVSVTVDAIRALLVGHGYAVLSPTLQSLAWAAGVIVVFVPLSVRAYRAAASR